MQHFNNLTPAEAERLAILAEECGEILQVIGKILRHGYDSVNPCVEHAPSNRQHLAIELGDLKCVTSIMVNFDDITEAAITDACKEKTKNIRRWLHHQSDFGGTL